MSRPPTAPATLPRTLSIGAAPTPPTPRLNGDTNKTSHISGTKPDFAQGFPPNISSSSSPSSSSPSARDGSRVMSKTQQVAPMQVKESAITDTRCDSSPTPAEPSPSPASTSSNGGVTSDRSFIDAFRGTFRAPSPLPLPVKVKMEALEEKGVRDAAEINL